MKILHDKDNEVTIILENNDILNIATLYGNKDKVIVKCLHNSLHIDELDVLQIEAKREEEKAIKAMKEYLKRQK